MEDVLLPLQQPSSDHKLWKNWEKTGKQSLVQELVRLLEEGENGRNGEQVREWVYLTLRKSLTGDLKKEKVTAFLKDMLDSLGGEGRSENQVVITSLITEAFVLLDEETNIHNELREKFVALVKSVDGMLGVVLAERLNMDSLGDLGVVQNKKTFDTRFIRLKTKLYFKQQKYNLFREESEGYAKLIAELGPPFDEDKSIEKSTEIIQCLIGRFNLDPNRVLDIVLEAFEANLGSNFFIPLIRNLNTSSSTVCELLGFKLLNQEGPSDSLFLEIALLLQHGVIDLEEMYSWLTPDDRFIRKEWDRQLKDAKEYARKSMIVTINKEKEGDEPEDISSPDDRFGDNQKFCLCEALIAIGDWQHAFAILNKYPSYTLVSRKRIAVKLIKLLEYVLDPIYRTIRTELKFLTIIPLTEKFPLFSQSEEVVKQVRTFGDLLNTVDIVLAIGPYIHHEPLLMYKLLRIIFYYLQMKRDPTTQEIKKTTLYFKFLDIFDEVLLPALSFLDSNCAVSEQVWNVLQYYPYTCRFRLYSSWKGEQLLLTHPALLSKRVDLIKKIKHLMRRISKENVKPMGRQLGKLAHSMPAVVFDYILSQIQLFDNLIAPVIDALKFQSQLSYDVLGFCLLEALSPSQSTSTGSTSVMLMPNRPRTKHDHSTIASWLQNLSAFTGAICKKYNIELVPILQYIANQLKAKQGLDLLLLKEVVQKMTGLEASEDITNEQLDALSGGELLRSEAGYFGQVRAAKKSGSRLRDAVSIHDLAVTLCILMSQQRDAIVYEDKEGQTIHTKLVGKLYDQCQDTLVQFGTFLSNFCTMDEYAKKLPPLKELLQVYYVSSDVAFFLWRPIFSYQSVLKYDELRRIEKNHKAMTVAQRQDKYFEACNAIFAPVADIMQNFFPQKIWEDISPHFYVTFWSLSLYDLHVPTEAYAKEIAKVKQASIAFGDNKDLPSSKRKKEQERCAMMIEKLQDEERRQRDHVDRVMAKLNKEKDSWFASRTAKSAKNEAVTAFLQHCLFPRCIFTAPDALYCAHFVTTIHLLSTPNFSTLICFDRIFCDIIYTVTSCTENEANRYGRFLCALLGTVMRWHGDKAVFDKECASFPGFVTKFRAANTMMTECSDHVDYENFRHVCHKWHYKITKCIIVCLESKDFIQIRNALIVLKRILPYYPKVQNLANAVERWIEKVRGGEKDKRQDLFALATSYIGQLKAKWNTLVSEEDFHQKPPTVGADKTTNSTTTNNSQTAQPSTQNSQGSQSAQDGVKQKEKHETTSNSNNVNATNNNGDTSHQVTNGSPAPVSMGSPLSSPEDKEKNKRKKEKEKDKSSSSSDRKRDRDPSATSNPESKRKRTDETYTKVIKTRGTSTSTPVSNGEVHREEKGSSRDRSPHHSSSTRGGGSNVSSSSSSSTNKKRSSRYK